jgi:inorganic triphosphatase YgiF
MTAEPGLEIELAFSLTDEATRRLLVKPICRASPVEMAAVYFDTPDRALRAAGYALRVRREGERWVQTLKSGSAGGLVRGEFERPLSQGSLDLSLLASAGLPRDLLARLSELRPVFETRVRRRQRIVAFGDAAIEVALDEGEVVAGARRTPLREVELELKTGGRAALFDYARQLAADGGLRLTFANKSDRGFALAAGTLGAAVGYSPPPVARLATVGDAIGSLGGAALHHFGGNLDLLQFGPRRAALRHAIAGAERLAALLSICAFLDEPGRRAVAAELDWILGLLTAARDLDRFIAGGFRPLAHWADDRPAAAVFGRGLLKTRRTAYREVQEAARSRRVSALLLDAAELMGTAPAEGSGETVDDQSISNFALGVLRCEELVVHAADGVLAGTDPIAQDELQKDVKRMGYLLDALEFALPPSARSRAARRRAFHRLGRNLDDLREVATARVVSKHVLDRLDIANEDLAARTVLAAGTIVIARFARSTKTLRCAQRALEALNARPSL